MDYYKSQSPLPQGQTNPYTMGQPSAPPPYFEHPQSGSGHITPQQGFGFSIPRAEFNQQPQAMGPAQPGLFTVQPSPYAPQFPKSHQFQPQAMGPAQPGFFTVQPSPYVPQFPQVPQRHPANDYLSYSIFTMLCCCLPIGIAALVNSILTRDANNEADWEAAGKRSRTALTLNNVALGLGGAIMGSAIIYVIVSAAIY